MKKTCFLIAPLGNSGSKSRKRLELLWEIVVDIVGRSGYTVIRADLIAHPGLIVDQIINYLTSADLVIADLSDGNPNVFYELGIRHATGLPVIHIAEEGNLVPFNVQSFRTFFYETSLADSKYLGKYLSSAIEAIESKESSQEGIVEAAFRLSQEKNNQPLPIRAYLSDNDPEKVKKITDAIDKLKIALDLIVVDDPPPKLNSWWKYWGTKTADVISEPEVSERLRKAERALEMHTLHKVQSEVDKNQAEAASAVLKSLETIASAAIQVGSLLVVKTTGENGAAIAVRTLTQNQLAMLEKNPSLLKTPADILIQLEKHQINNYLYNEPKDA